MADSATANWNYIRSSLARHGAEVSVSSLPVIRHDVVLSPKIHERLGRSDRT